MRFLKLTILLSVWCFTGFSQSRSDIGIFLGGSYYTGDLNPRGHFNSLTQPAAGIIYRYNFNPRIAVRGNAFFGKLQGDDARSSNDFQQQRNLHFKSSLFELSGQLEFNFLEYEIGDEKRPFTPYAFLGVGGFKFKPQAAIDGTWIPLRDLGTEGQGTELNDKKKYNLIQVSVPFGIGIKVNLASKIGLAIEWGMRKTFTDYLDDVSKVYVNPAILAATNGPNAALMADRSLNNTPESNIGRQRGNSSTKDLYSFAGIILSFKLNGKPEKCHSYN